MLHFSNKFYLFFQIFVTQNSLFLLKNIPFHRFKFQEYNYRRLLGPRSFLIDLRTLELLTIKISLLTVKLTYDLTFIKLIFFCTSFSFKVHKISLTLFAQFSCYLILNHSLKQ